MRPHLGCARPVPRSIAGSGARSIHARPISHGHSFGRDPRDHPAPFTSPRGPHPRTRGTLITRFSSLSSLLWGPKPSTD